MTVDNQQPNPVYATIRFNPKTIILKKRFFYFFDWLRFI